MHLATPKAAPAPIELTEVFFYREFGWTPQELRAVPLAKLLAILTVVDVQHKYDARPKPKKVNAA